MAFCAKCGASLNAGAAFCPSCGAVVGATPGPTPPAPIGPPVTAAPKSSNVAAALSYLLGFITGIIFLVIEPYRRDSFVRFHAFQSIFLSAGYVILSIVWGAVFGVMVVASFGFLWTVLAGVWVLVRIAFFVLWLFMMYKAYNNERYQLPFIGPIAAKQAGA